MSKASVRDILKQIDQLTGKQRELLNRRLMEKEDRELEKELRAARAKAKRDGITQEVIDQAVMELRYGR